MKIKLSPLLKAAKSLANNPVVKSAVVAIITDAVTKKLTKIK